MRLVTPAEIRGARGMLGWSMAELAVASRISVSTVKRLETIGPPQVSAEVSLAVRVAFEAVGVRFLDDVGERGGVMMPTRRAPGLPERRDHPPLPRPGAR